MTLSPSINCSLTETISERSKEVLYGAAGSVISLSSGYGIMNGLTHVMAKWGLTWTRGQSYFLLYEYISTISDQLLRNVLKVFAITYITVFVPLVEEWLFRGLLYDWQQSGDKSSETFWTKAFRVVSNGLIFGAFHLNIFNGWVNLLLFTVTAVVGMIFAALREITGNWRASMVAHSLNNSFVMLFKFLQI